MPPREQAELADEDGAAALLTAAEDFLVKFSLLLWDGPVGSNLIPEAMVLLAGSSSSSPKGPLANGESNPGRDSIVLSLSKYSRLAIVLSKVNENAMVSIGLSWKAE